MTDIYEYLGFDVRVNINPEWGFKEFYLNEPSRGFNRLVSASMDDANLCPVSRYLLRSLLETENSKLEFPEWVWVEKLLDAVNASEQAYWKAVEEELEDRALLKIMVEYTGIVWSTDLIKATGKLWSEIRTVMHRLQHRGWVKQVSSGVADEVDTQFAVTTDGFLVWR